MPVPNPTPRELAEAGALIVGVRRRTALLEAQRESRTEGDKWVWRVALIYVLLAALSIVAVSEKERVGVMLAAAAVVLAGVTLVVSTKYQKPTELVVGYQPDELRQLVGYVEAFESSEADEPRTTQLGELAVRTYYAFREPGHEHPWFKASASEPASEPLSEHRPLEAS